MSDEVCCAIEQNLRILFAKYDDEFGEVIDAAVAYLVTHPDVDLRVQRENGLAVRFVLAVPDGVVVSQEVH